MKASNDIQTTQAGTGNSGRTGNAAGTGKGAIKLKGLRWYIISLIGLATIINYIDRGAINFMWPYIYKDFGIADGDSKNALALITTFFMVAYAIGQTVTGKMMDAIGARLGMAVSIIGWSISIALHALAKSILSFNIFRFYWASVKPVTGRVLPRAMQNGFRPKKEPLHKVFLVQALPWDQWWLRP